MTSGQKTVTAAPTTRTAFVVSVCDADGHALNGAGIEVSPASGATQHGMTASGKPWRSKPVAPGDCVITVTVDGFGPPPPPTSSPSPLPPPIEGPISQTITVPLTAPPTTPVTFTFEQARPRVIVTVVDRTYGNLPVIGAKVEVGGQGSASGLTDLEGKFTSGFLPLGRTTVVVTKDGYQQSFLDWSPRAAGTNPNAAVLGVNLPAPVDTPVEVALDNQWGRVTSSNITVGGVAFVDWFNGTFQPSHTNVLKIAPAFNDIFDAFVPSAWPSALSLDEFIAIVLVINHETGGKFTSISELYNPPDKYRYFFEPFAKSGKASYNQGANRKAGALLRDRGVLSEPGDHALIVAWSAQQPYPGLTAKVTEAAVKECDFYKYRGRGLIQVTWHDNYATQVFADALVANGHGSAGMSVVDVLDACPNDDMDNLVQTAPDVYFALVRGWMTPRRRSFLEVNYQRFEGFRQRVNTGPRYSTYAADCAALRQAMIAGKPKLQ